MVKNTFPPATNIAMRLEESKGAEFTETEIVVELTRQMDLEWLVENPKRFAHVQKTARELAGREIAVRFRVAKSETTSPGSGAVELPAEGQRLEDLAREIFEKG